MRRTAGALLAAAVLVGCGERNGGPEVTYRLVALEAGPLPVVLQVDSCMHLLRAGDVRIAGSKFTSSFAIEMMCRNKGVRPEPIGATGRITHQGDSLIFQDSAGTVMGRGLLRSDTLRIAGPTRRLTYVRQ